MREVTIDTEYITLGQLLKKLDLLDTGGQAKHFLSENRVWVNGEPEERRGRKIYPRDTVEIEGFGTVRPHREG
ncbi:S4 domain protein YaaA [Melghirimyces profundicolus]|uniref:S4 domain protein YaaA n=1 Tax=Melghirimyces profundicolus TaxID=1242148 RepID=A0A2T6BAI0_9BACL|nr:S4 domain-containing protein YaaA [Melghirimyces profundicolus]PTX53069.1 S4 domain protein YaaA [Melghirimyces profundicolus]